MLQDKQFAPNKTEVFNRSYYKMSQRYPSIQAKKEWISPKAKLTTFWTTKIDALGWSAANN